MTLLQAIQFGWHSGYELSKVVGVSEREIRKQVMDYRLQGYPIISGDLGYTLTNDYKEIKKCCARLSAHATAELKIATAMEKRARLVQDPVQLKMAL